MATPAFAQETQPAAPDCVANPNDPRCDEDEAIVVVGSRIRRDEFNAPSPIQIITREESTLAGFSSTTEALQGNGATGGSAQINNYFGGFVTDGGPGANTLSLRGLGATRTLILLNGRRIAPAGTRGAVGSADLNVLPTAMVDHYEILKDGASSIYGSDAVAGVVNIVTERGVDGWTIEGDYRGSEHGGAEATTLSLTGGYTSDSWEISGSLEVYNREPLLMNQRDWTACQVDLTRDPVTGASLDYIDPTTGNPKCYLTGSTGQSGVTINTIGTRNTYFDEGITVAPGALPVCDFVTIGADCTYYMNRWRPNAAVTGGAMPGYEGVGGAYVDPTGSFLVGTPLNIRDTFEPQMLATTMVSPVRNTTGFLQGSFDLGGGLGQGELYFEALISRRESEQVGYRQLAADYPRNSPLLPGFLNTQTTAVAQTGHPNVNALRAFIGFGNDHSSQEVTYVRGVVGLRGQLWGGWRYDAGVMHSATEASYTFETFLWDHLQASMYGCSLNFAGRPADFTSLEGCVSAPALTPAVVGGELPQAWRDYIFQPVTGENTFDESTVFASVDGTLFELPAGPVQAAFGVEYRSSYIHDQPPAESLRGNMYNLTSGVVTHGSDAVREAFAEVEVPVLADVPAAHELTLNVSGRYTDYDSYGSNETYKYGGLYSPVSWVSLRATYGTSFRAPGLFEQFLGATTGFLAAQNDPCANYASQPTSSNRYINCHSEINDLAFTQPTSSLTVIASGGAGTGALAAETSTNLTYGIIFQPPLPGFIGDLSVAVDYYKIEVDDEVEQPGAGNILALCYDDPQFRAGGGYCNLVGERDPVSRTLAVNNSYTNIASQVVEGVDYNLRYVRDIGLGTFRVNALVTQYLTQDTQLSPTDPVDHLNGTLTAPEYTAQVDFTYDIKEWTFRYGVGWLAGMDSNELVQVDPSVDPYDFSTDDYFLQNASIRYRSAAEWEITVGARNLADEDPPEIPAFAYNRVANALLYSGYDYFGRQFFINVSKHF